MDQTASINNIWSQTAKADFDSGVRTYHSTLLRYCKKLTGSRWEAEDLAQDTMLRALPKLVNEYDNPQAYLFRVAKNAWIDQRRKRDVAAKLINEYQPLDDAVDTLTVQEAIMQLITHLSPLQRTVVLLQEVFQFTSREAADMLGTSEGAVKAALHRARKTLDSLRGKAPDETAALPRADAEADKDLLQAYVLAFQSYDMQAIVALAQNDVIHPVHALHTLATAIQADKRAMGTGKRGPVDAVGSAAIYAAA